MAVERIVQVLLKPESVAKAGSILAEARRVFPTIPGVTGFACGVGEAPQHIVLCVQFAKFADVPAYKAHPIHETFAATHLRPHAAHLEAHNYDIKPARHA